ncbi:PIN domain-like protein, partial [Trametes cingulata]
MGVPGLWDILRPAGKPRSLTHLSVKDGFEANPDGKRGLRVGVDASIWFFHATYGREGENPELRTMFFRCTRLMSMPFLPLFVFDGPKRPDIKRGKRITGKNHWMVQGMQEIITAFGFEWRMAPGEAEAELAYLNRIGVIDAVLSDDVDTFLFGAKTVIRNPSATLSGNRGHSLKNAAGKDDGNHAMIYRSSDILNHEDIQLTQGGLILIGILRGGDYCQEGLDGCGVTTAHGLAKCGFGDSLLKAARTMSREDLEDFLVGWRQEIRDELRTNSRGHLPRKSPKLAKSVPEDFPRVDVVLAYTTPVTSEAKGPGHKNTVVDWDKEPDLGKIAAVCEMYFEWGIKEVIIKRFRNVLWPSAVLRILRRAAILRDRKAALLASRGGNAGAMPVTPRKNGKERRAPPGTPSSMIAKHFSTMRLDSPHARREMTLDEEDEEEEGERLIVKIHSSRRHPSTDNILEYRLEIAPAQLVRLCEAGIRGLRTALPPDLSDEDDDDDDSEDDEDGGGKKKGKKKVKKPPPPPDSHLRIWLPACMVEMVEPELVEAFEKKEREKAEKKAAKGKGRKGAAAAGA